MHNRWHLIILCSPDFVPLVVVHILLPTLPLHYRNPNQEIKHDVICVPSGQKESYF